VAGLAPATNFEANTQLSCTGRIEFTDKTGNLPTSWAWNFGDGNTSTLQNPVHTYANSGTYTVTLTTTNGIGSDIETKTSYITVATPTVSSVQNGEGCPNTSIALGAVGNGQLRWFDGSNTRVATGANYNTPTLTNTTTYQVQDAITQPSLYTTPSNPTFGAGGYHGSGFTGAINFTADTGFVFVSAWVDADGAGDRVVYLWDGNIANGGTVNNTVLQQVTVTLVDGPQQINLNLEVPGAGNYAIGGSNMNMYRNNGGVSYPYTVPNILTMTSSTAGTPGNFYYYLYDIEIQLAPCLSPLQPVTATVIESDFTFNSTGNTTTFTDNSNGATSWFWDFGDGNTSTLQNPVHTYAATGNYTVTLTINNTCSSQDVVSFVTSVAALGEEMEMQLLPNPTTNQTTLQFSQPLTEDLNIEILAIDGRVLQQQIMRKGTRSQVLDLTDYPSAVYLVRMSTNEGVDIRKIVKE
jgi:PKD repeat protein